MPDATSVGTAGTPGDGPYVRIWLKTENGLIRNATYATNGCPSSIGCSSALCELSVGREMKKMLLLEPKELDLFLGGLAPGKFYYAELAIQAMREAIGGENA